LCRRQAEAGRKLKYNNNRQSTVDSQQQQPTDQQQTEKGREQVQEMLLAACCNTLHTFWGVLHSGQVQLIGCNVRIQVIIIDSHSPPLCV